MSPMVSAWPRINSRRRWTERDVHAITDLEPMDVFSDTHDFSGKVVSENDGPFRRWAGGEDLHEGPSDGGDVDFVRIEGGYVGWARDRGVRQIDVCRTKKKKRRRRAK